MNSYIERCVQLLNAADPVIMGILNVTPDSFSDGGRYTQVGAALSHALQMHEQGAHIIDVGGESTRPGAKPVSVDEEIDRVLPVIEAIRNHSDVLISIDSSKPAVMRAAVNAGASLVNDVYALRAADAIDCCAELGVPVCLMHMQGEPRSMQHSPQYDDVLVDVMEFLQSRAQTCIDAGIDKSHIMLDPGIGFGKSLQHNLALLSGLDRICELEFPVLIGISRKSMLGAILDQPVEQRLAGSIAALVMAYEKGANAFRVHDVVETRDALKVCEAIESVNQ